MTFTLILFFLILSALFSGSEIAFVSANKLRIELKKNKGSRRGAILAHFYEKPADFLGTMLVGNNIALVIFTMLMTDIVLTPFFQTYFGIENELLLLLVTTILITIIVLIFGEFLPKTLFRLFADDVLYFLAYPLRFLQWLLWVASWVMIRCSNLFLKVFFDSEVSQVENALTRVDLGDFIQSSMTEENDDIDTDLFHNVLQLREVKVKECMIPRPEIEDVDVNDSIEDLEQLFRETKLSRLIVTEDDIDNVLGYVHHAQMLKNPKDIKRLILNIPFVPETMRAQALMNRFIKTGTTIACVVDEYGGVAGIITLEDILEEIFGEIEDEHDQEEYIETQVSDKEFIFSGRLEIDYLNEKYDGLDFPEGEYETLSGYLVTTTETIPEQNAEILLDGYKYILELVSDTKIETIRVVKLDGE
jgi:putative hemolysin